MDAWFSWTSDLVAHGRNETVRADSAEATLRATLARLERMQADTACRTPGADQLPRRRPRVNGAGPADGTGPDTGTDEADPARLETVDTTLREVMALLHRLVGPQ